MKSFAKKENLLKDFWVQEKGCSHPSPPCIRQWAPLCPLGPMAKLKKITTKAWPCYLRFSLLNWCPLIPQLDSLPVFKHQHQWLLCQAWVLYLFIAKLQTVHGPSDRIRPQKTPKPNPSVHQVEFESRKTREIASDQAGSNNFCPNIFF